MLTVDVVIGKIINDGLVYHQLGYEIDKRS